MTFTSKKLEGDKLQLTVELNKEDLSIHVERAEVALGRDLEVSGFRKGKAPRDIIRKQIGPMKILEAALESAVQSTLAQAIQEQDLDVIEATDLKIQENTPEKLVYTIVIQLFPEAKLPRLETISVARRPVSVESKEVDQALESIKASRSILSEKDSPAAAGDRVEVDFEVTDQGVLIEGGVSKNHPLIIGAGNFIPGFEDHLIGMKKGEQKKFTLTAPKDFATKQIAGKTLDFNVTLRDLKAVSLPELTDEFAKTLGKFETMEQLIMSVKEGLTNEKIEKENQRVRVEIMDAIAAKTTCTVPPAMIENQLESMIRDFDQDLHSHDMELAMYLSKMNKTEDDLRKEWRAQAERQVKLSIILHTVAREQDITVSSQESDEALAALLETTMAQRINPAEIDTERVRQNVQAKLLNEKIFEYLEKVCAPTNHA